MSHHKQVSIMRKPGTSCVHCRLFCLSAERTTDCNLGCFKRCFEKDAVLSAETNFDFKKSEQYSFFRFTQGITRISSK